MQLRISDLLGLSQGTTWRVIHANRGAEPDLNRMVVVWCIWLFWDADLLDMTIFFNLTYVVVDLRPDLMIILYILVYDYIWDCVSAYVLVVHGRHRIYIYF